MTCRSVAIMQPYLFPYLGYYQLTATVDNFIFLQDVNFRKKGYINRNSVVLGESVHRFTEPVENASQNRRISEHQYIEHGKGTMKMLSVAYRDAPYFDTAMTIIEGVYSDGCGNVAETNRLSVMRVLEYIGAVPSCTSSSAEIDSKRDLAGEQRLIAMCKSIGATQYVNLPGGRSLYSAEAFARHGISLGFLQPWLETSIHKKIDDRCLSIVHFLMFLNRKILYQILKSATIESVNGGVAND